MVARARHCGPLLVRHARVRGRGSLFVRLALDQPRPAVVAVRADRHRRRRSRRTARGAPGRAPAGRLLRAAHDRARRGVQPVRDGRHGQPRRCPGPRRSRLDHPAQQAGPDRGLLLRVRGDRRDRHRRPARVLVGVVRPARPAPEDGTRVGARRASARHRHSPRAARGVRDHGRRPGPRRGLPRVVRCGRQQERVRLLDAAPPVRDDRRRRHQLAEGHPARHRAAAVHRAALRELGRSSADPAGRDHAADHALHHRRPGRHPRADRAAAAGPRRTGRRRRRTRGDGRRRGP